MTTVLNRETAPGTDEGWCELYQLLDSEFETDPRSALHHDNRCPVHAFTLNTREVG